MIGEYIAPLIRFRELRRTIDVVVVRGTAQEFVESIEEFLGGSPIRTVEDLMLESNNTGYFPQITLNNFYNALKSTGHQPVVTLGGTNDTKNFHQDGEKWGDRFNIPGNFYAGDVPRKGGNKIEFLGCALFDGDKMVGKLNGNETRTMLLATGDYNRGIFTVQDPKRPELIIPIDLKLGKKTYVKIQFTNGKPMIHLKLKTEGDIFAIQSRINYEDPKLVYLVENTVEGQLKDTLDKVIEKCKSLNCDVFNFGYTAARQFLTIEEWEKYNWKKHFKDAEITTEVEFSIRRTGGLLKSSEIITSEGKE